MFYHHKCLSFSLFSVCGASVRIHTLGPLTKFLSSFPARLIKNKVDTYFIVENMLFMVSRLEKVVPFYLLWSQSE